MNSFYSDSAAAAILSEPAISSHTGYSDRERQARQERLERRKGRFWQKAVFLSELADSWSKVDALEAEAALRRGLAVTRLLSAMNFPGERSTGNPADIYISLAATWSSAAPERADIVSREALNHIRRLKGPKQRDLKLRILATVTASGDRPNAVKIAEAIGDPLIRLWAFREMADRLSGIDKTTGVKLLERSVVEASRVEDIFERARAVREAAVRLMAVEPVSGRRALAEATRLTLRIEDSLRKALAVSELAGVWARWDGNKPFELAALIPVERPDIRGALFLRSADRVMGDELKRRLLDAAHREATRLDLRTDRDSLLSGVAERMAGIDPRVCLSIIQEIETSDDYYVSRSMEGAAHRLVKDNPGLARELVLRIEPVDLRAKILISWIKSDQGLPETDIPDMLDWIETLPGIAGGDEWEASLAQAWIHYSMDKAIEALDEIESLELKARTLAVIAVNLAKRGQASRADTFRKWAVKVAMGEGAVHVPDKSRILKTVGDVYAPAYPEYAAIMYESAFRLAVGEKIVALQQ